VGKDTVGISPCCQSHTKTVANSEFDFETNDYLSYLRGQEKADACQRCWDIEEQGGYSKRHAAIDFFKIQPSNEIELNVLEYNATWACNLACIMCGPENSSTWANELGIKDSHDKMTQTKNQIVARLDKSKLSRIHFNGGEPLINDEHVKILKQVDRLDHCKITYNTNGTVLPSDKTLAVWEKCKMVRLFFSIDAIGDAFEYIRWPGRWNLIQDNIAWFIKHSPSNVMFGLNVTVGAYNLLELVELYDWHLDTMAVNREGDGSDFNCQIAYNFDPAWLDDHVKSDVLTVLKKHSVFDPIASHLKKNASALQSQTWISKLDEIDQRRKLDWKTALKIGKYYI
jgi:hypothetical protein